MKTIKYIFFYTILLCIIANGSAVGRICIETDGCDSGIEWSVACHTQNNTSHDSPHSPHSQQSAVGHNDSECLDIWVESSASSNVHSYLDDYFNLSKPLIVKLATLEHLFSSFNFSKLRKTTLPVFKDNTSLSIESTVLVI